MGEGITVRCYEPGDLEACRALWAELTEWHRRLYDDPTIGGDNPAERFDDHLGEVGPEQVWVAVVDGRDVGMAGMIRGEHSVVHEPVVVEDEFRGTGVGRSLVETVAAAARSQGFPQLRVRPAARNADAIGFFHRLGFSGLGRLELVSDLTGGRSWRTGQQLAGRDFLV